MTTIGSSYLPGWILADHAPTRSGEPSHRRRDAGRSTLPACDDASTAPFQATVTRCALRLMEIPSLTRTCSVSQVRLWAQEAACTSLAWTWKSARLSPSVTGC